MRWLQERIKNLQNSIGNICLSILVKAGLFHSFNGFFFFSTLLHNLLKSLLRTHPWSVFPSGQWTDAAAVSSSSSAESLWTGCWETSRPKETVGQPISVQHLMLHLQKNESDWFTVLSEDGVSHAHAHARHVGDLFFISLMTPASSLRFWRVSSSQCQTLHVFLISMILYSDWNSDPRSIILLMVSGGFLDHWVISASCNQLHLAAN